MNRDLHIKKTMVSKKDAKMSSSRIIHSNECPWNYNQSDLLHLSTKYNWPWFISEVLSAPILTGYELAKASAENIRTRLSVTVSIADKIAVNRIGMQITSMILINCPPKFVWALYISLYAVAKKLRQWAAMKMVRILSRSSASKLQISHISSAS